MAGFAGAGVAFGLAGCAGLGCFCTWVGCDVSFSFSCSTGAGLLCLGTCLGFSVGTGGCLGVGFFAVIGFTGTGSGSSSNKLSFFTLDGLVLSWADTLGDAFGGAVDAGFEVATMGAGYFYD